MWSPPPAPSPAGPASQLQVYGNRSRAQSPRSSQHFGSSQSLTRLGRLHAERIIHAIEVVEHPRHRRDLDDLSLVVILTQPREHRVIDRMRVERQLLRVG